MKPARGPGGEIASRLSFALGTTAFVVVMLVPLVSPIDPAADPTGAIDTDHRVTLVSREGWTPALVSLGLVAASALPLIARRTLLVAAAQRVAAVALVVGCLLSIRTVGLVHVPSAAAMVVAAVRQPRDPFR